MSDAVDRVDEAIGAAIGFLKAENFILREILNAVIGLGLRSNAWTKLEAEYTLAQLSEKLLERAKKDKADTTHSQVLRDFALFAATALHSPTETN